MPDASLSASIVSESRPVKVLDVKSALTVLQQPRSFFCLALIALIVAALALAYASNVTWKIDEGPFNFDSEAVGSKPSGWMWFEYPGYPWSVQNDQSVSPSNSLKSSLPNVVSLNQAFRPTDREYGAIEAWMRHDQGVVGLEGVQEFGFRFRYKDDFNFYQLLAGINYIGLGKRVFTEPSCDPITKEPASNWIALARIAGPGAEGPTFNNLTSTFSSPNNVWQQIRVEIWPENSTSDHLRAYADGLPILDAIDPCPNFRTGGMWGVYHWNWVSCPGICNQWYDDITIFAPSTTNNPPVLDPIGDRSIDEETLLTFTAHATDPDAGQTITLSASGLPAGATFNSATGQFSWTPGEAHGPGDYLVTFTATDNGTPSLSDAESVSITVNEVNVAPVLVAIGNKSVNEETLLIFTATATDTDIPANTLTFSVGAGAPSGAAITVAGVFTWTPTEAQGPSSFSVTVIVTDNGSPVMSDSETITITVAEVNRAPTVNVPGPQNVALGNTLTFTGTCTDPDIPANILALSATGLVTGMTFNTATGVFSFTPVSSQNGMTFTVSFTCTDNGTPVLSDTKSVTITVSEVNVAPVLTVPGAQTVNELVTLTFTVTFADSDIPANTVTLACTNCATIGATFNALTGAFSWTPTEAQGPGLFTVTFTATDNGIPSLSDTKSVTITVNEVNVAPVLGAIGDKTVDELVLLTFTATATDPDAGQTLTFSLGTGAPAGAAITTGGIFAWTPTETQGLGSYSVTVIVTDSVGASDSETITITVREVNQAPVLVDFGDKTVVEENPLTFSATAYDLDIPEQTLTFSLAPASAGIFPEGATIGPTTGMFTWTPTQDQGPGTYTVRIVVSDGTAENFEDVTISVLEDLPPPWPTESTLRASNVGQTSLTLTWTAATDERGVVGYRIYLRSILFDTVAGNVYVYTVTGLEPGREYTFKIEAGDVTDKWSNDGPSLTVRTLAAQTPFRPDNPFEPTTTLAILLVIAALFVLASIVFLRSLREKDKTKT